jgi:hypothetical protein
MQNKKPAAKAITYARAASPYFSILSNITVLSKDALLSYDSE